MIVISFFFFLTNILFGKQLPTHYHNSFENWDNLFSAGACSARVRSVKCAAIVHTVCYVHLFIIRSVVGGTVRHVVCPFRPTVHIPTRTKRCMSSAVKKITISVAYIFCHMSVRPDACVVGCVEYNILYKLL